MGKFDFDKIIDRRGTGALKVDCLEERFGRKDILPFWVADMCFESSPAITEAIIERTKHGVFGYTSAPDSYWNSIVDWLSSYHQWKVERDWLAFIPGIVKGISFTIDCFLKEGDKVLIQPPVYPPFENVPKLRGKAVVKSFLKEKNGRFEIDFDDFEQQIDEHCKLFILCNPHNPGGRVWTREELQRIAEICYEKGVLVLSDEIHSDLVFEGHKHIPFASVSEKAAMNSITFMAPSKTFNIAGIISSFSVVPNPELKAKFDAYLELSELTAGHIFAYTATEAAYSHGLEWLEEAKEYIWHNICLTKEYLEKNIPEIKPMVPEASYLIWLDCRALGLTQKELVSFFVNDAKLALNDGATFGGEDGYMRMNVGCPKKILEQGLANLKQAVEQKFRK